MNNPQQFQGNQPDLSGIINLITSNPSLVSSIASMLGGGKKENVCPPPPPDDHTECGCQPPPPPPPPCNVLSPKSRYSDEICLLNALKPFMSPKRCDAIETIIKISKVLELINNCR